jgi:hypothetical protein
MSEHETFVQLKINPTHLEAMNAGEIYKDIIIWSMSKYPIQKGFFSSSP